MKTTFLRLAVLVALPAAAQTVVTPPRSITSQQETPGVDSTFEGNVQPNAQTSSITINTGAAAPAPAPPPPAPAPAPAPMPAPTPAPPPPSAKKYGSCMVTSPNGPDVENVLFDLSTNHIVEADFDSAPVLTTAQQAEVQGGYGACPNSVTIYYNHVYPSANALAAGYASSDYLETWDTYPDPAFPNGPAW
jgi:hypothetical protein